MTMLLIFCSVPSLPSWPAGAIKADFSRYDAMAAATAEALSAAANAHSRAYGLTLSQFSQSAHSWAEDSWCVVR